MTIAIPNRSTGIFDRSTRCDGFAKRRGYRRACMSENPDLLMQLRLDRSVSQKPSAHRWTPAWAAVAALALAGVGVWWLSARPSGAHLTAASIKSVARTNQPASASPAKKPSSLEASGYVVARRQATVSAETTGRVSEVLVEEGQHVATGQVIARLDDARARATLEEAAARLAQAQAESDAARIAAENAYPTYLRAQKQNAAGLISAQAFDSARAAYEAVQADRLVKDRAADVSRAVRFGAQRNWEQTVVRAPFAGMVTVKAAQPGEIVSPLSANGGFARTGIGTIVDMDSLEVEVDVNETFIGGVRPGQSATIRLNAYPDWDIPAETIAVVPTVDRAKATVKVRVGFEAKDPRILPDMGVRVSFLRD
jgi:RND family efflux transporter MFP subunit